MSDDNKLHDEDKPRRSFWATMPRGSLGRVFLLLLLLAAVVYLQRRSGDIAGCANKAFQIPPPPSTGSSSPNRASSAGTIRARVILPEKTSQ